ncbi:MAG TPA: hypothetical protein VFC29_17490 [Candidatus Limnocylindrales bacterium]|nr:hypothetical protein [Candidatus Limnocylindrales bacterium]
MFEGTRCAARPKAFRLVHSLLPQSAGFVDLGGYLLNPRYDPALLRQRRQGDFSFLKLYGM